jgi:hypothetical protein
MIEQYKFFFVTTAVICVIGISSYWGTWVTSTLMSVDKEMAVVSEKMDDQHDMLVSIMEHLSANQKASWAPDVRASFQE